MGVILESVENMISTDMSLEKNNKQKEYLDYIEKHKTNVMISYKKYFLPLLDQSMISKILSDEEIKEAIKRAAIIIQDHDASKYGDDEFDAYREKYYPTASEIADPDFKYTTNEKFQKAWESHYTNNWHHPAYWIDKETKEIKDMNLEAIIEMICDWCSFNVLKDGLDGCRKWYENEADREKSEMSDNTKRLVDEFMYNILKE